MDNLGGEFVVNLDDLTAKKDQTFDKNGTTQLQTRSTKQSFFPLAVDDYFMSVAILSNLGSSTEVR